MTTAPEPLQEKSDRIRKAAHLEPVDRVPVVFMGVAFAPRYVGMSMAEVCADPEATMKANLAAMDRLGGFDGINFADAGPFTEGLAKVWLSRIKVPGRDLPPDSLWQVNEAEVMTTDDYDFIINNGWEGFLDSYLPRVTNLAESQRATDWMKTNFVRCVNTYRDRGYVPVCASRTPIPAEIFSGGRSMQKFFSDLYRIPDKVQAAMDVVFPELIEHAIKGARETGVQGVWVASGRGALVSPKLFDRFVWPYIAKAVDALVEADLMPVLHWDQDWTLHLARLRELPAKRCVLNPDSMTDAREFKRLVGDRMAMMGDVPASLFATGTPEDVQGYVRGLVRLFGSTGLLLCPGCEAPIDAKPENMGAFVAAGHKFGDFRSLNS